MRKTVQLCLLLVPVVVLLAAIASPAPASGGTTITRQSVVGDTFTCNGDVFTTTAGAFKVTTREALTPSGAYHLIVEGNAQGVRRSHRAGRPTKCP